MSRYRKKPAMLAGIVLVTLIFTSQLLSIDTINEVPGSRDSQDGYNPGAISSSAANEIVQLAGSNQVVRYVARNASAVTVGNTPAASNLTLPATPAPATVLDATNTSLRFDTTTKNKTHVIEDESGSDYPSAKSKDAIGDQPWLNTTVGSMSDALITGTTAPTSSYKNLNSGTAMNTAWEINSQNISSTPTVQVNLDYPNVAGITFPNSIRLDTLLKMKFNRSVWLDVYIFDNRNGQGWVKASNDSYVYDGLHNPTWVKVTGGQIVLDGGPGLPEQNITVKLKDVHSQSIRSGNPGCVNVSLVFTSTARFKAQLFTAKARLYQSYEFPIHADNWVALSFDLRGGAWVHGLSMYLRATNMTASETLYMRVFRTNNPSITLSQIQNTSTLSIPTQRPDLGQFVTGTFVSISNYNKDGINWINFSSPVYMAVGNYFVVLNSSVSNGKRYSIVVLPHNNAMVSARDPDLRVDHTVAITTNDGSSWTEGVAASYKADAAPFAVGVKRGLIPSDVNLEINGTSVADWQMSTTLPFLSTNYEWGRGNWSVVNLNARTTISTFKLPITWNHTVQASFTYNASASMLVHAEDAGTSLLKLSRTAPLWKVSYQFNKTKYASWSGLYFNYTFPSDWSVLNVTYPDTNDYYQSIYLSSISSSRKMYPVNYTSINGLDPGIQQSTYVSWFTSPNYTKSVDTYLRFNATTFYETQHFVNGDSMAARVFVQTGNGKAVLNGQVNLTMYYPSESQATTTASSVINSTVGFITKYHFSDASLHTFAGAAVGRHLARVFWFNGSEAGIYYHDVFKVNYTVIGYHVNELLEDGVDQVSGSIITGANESIPTDIVHVSIDKDDVVPIGLEVNQTLGNITFVEFNQTQTVFNPGESISFSVKLKSRSIGLQYPVRASVQVVEAFHPDRVMMSLSTATVVLNHTGGVNSERTLSISGTFPSGGFGVNAPLRNSLFMTRVKIYVDGHLAKTWASTETYAVNMGNTTDGTVLAAKVIGNYTGASFSQLFTRANETVFNQKTMFMMLIESSGGVTLPGVLARDFTNSMTSNIKEMTVAPVIGDVLTKNNNMTLTGRLYFENGSLVNDTEVHVSKYNGTAWVNYTVTGSTTNNTLPVSNGTFSGIFGLSSVYNRTVSVRFTFDGIISFVTGTSADLVINVTDYNSAWTIKVEASSIVVVGGSYRNYYMFVVNNTGNTTLMFDNYVRLKDSIITGYNASWINAGLLNVAPGTQFSFAMILTADNPGLGHPKAATFLLELHAFSVETKEAVNVTVTFAATVQPPDLGNQLASVWYLGYFGAIALLVIVAFFLLKRVSAQAKRPVEVGALAKGKATAKGGELPYAVKKGADLAKPEGEKKYKSIDEAMAEVKPEAGKDAASKDEDAGEEEASEPEAGDAKPAADAEKEEK